MDYNSDDETLTTVDMEESQEHTFVPLTFGYIPYRDLHMKRGDALFDHIVDNRISNHITTTVDVDTPSVCDILLDMFKSKNAWRDIIYTQQRIINRNKQYLIDSSYNSNREYARSLMLNELDTITSHESHMIISEKSQQLIEHSTFIDKFIGENSEALTTISDDDDEPLNIFKIKLPVWYRGDHGYRTIRWSSLEQIMKETVNESISPALPRGRFCPIRYIRRLFNSRVISDRTSTQANTTTDFSSVICNIRNKVSISYQSLYGKFAFYVRNSHHSQHSGIGKARYTMGFIMRWFELMNFHLFRDQLAHSIRYAFYRNIKTMPMRFDGITGTLEPTSYIHAHTRTLTDDTMPDDPDDPVMLTPFEKGMVVYKMACCNKDLLQDTIVGILHSGRSPRCPMCRADLLTYEDGYSPNPMSSEDRSLTTLIEYGPEDPDYLHNPDINPLIYNENPLTLL